MFVACIQTTEGVFTARFSATGLAGLDFPNPRAGTSATANGEAPSRKMRRWLRVTESALGDVLRGRTPRELPPMDLSAGTDFQRRVWRELTEIERGQTRSYGEIAGRLARPQAARAVGGACGANPIPVLVPCHRVLAANRRLGGFSGGLSWKRKLLAIENCPLRD